MKKVALLLLVAVCLGAGGVQAGEPSRPATLAAEAERCPLQTGSRLSPPRDDQGRCEQRSAFTRSYSQEDLERTGEVDLNRALEQLDPSFNRGR